MTFKFKNETDRDRVLDMSPWAIHGHCLNLKVCQTNQYICAVNFGKMQIWVQVHGLGLDMLNNENANSIGKCLELENETEMQKCGYIMMKTEVGVDEPLTARFWWKNVKGIKRWATIKYERFSDFCYGCGSLRHTLQACNSKIVLSEVSNRLPIYGSWLTCARQMKQSD